MVLYFEGGITLQSPETLMLMKATALIRVLDSLMAACRWEWEKPVQTLCAIFGNTTKLDLIWGDLTCVEPRGLSAHPSDHVSVKRPTCFWEPDFPLCPWGNIVAAVEPPDALLWFAGEGGTDVDRSPLSPNKAQCTEHSVPEIAQVVWVG